MTEGRAHAEAIRQAKYDAIEEVMKALGNVSRKVPGKDKDSPTRSQALNDARSAVSRVREQYRSKAQIARDNAAYRAARDGGAPSGAAYVSADMKPDNL